MNEAKQSVIIVAGGSGSRMQSEMPKQFIKVAGKEILLHTIDAFLSYSKAIHIILVLPVQYLDTWQQKLSEVYAHSQLSVCAGGASRTDSVRNGLALCHNEGIVAIHDAARPFISATLIAKCFETAQQHGACIPCIRCNDSTRIITTGDNATIDDSICSKNFDRNQLLLVQTPQCFNAEKLKSLYNNASGSFSDDASLWEQSGETIYICEGESKNIKITTPIDLQVAKVLLSSE
ncbi:MAG: 2-C-methyl-D-erythritol 4-phosphate cytidylyltransferase [Chitinophagales bacterium]|jgi:2-C-methyl-D-erythritol 4-phosphate cytidylyltransferase|nr:2-C-methyl-D-erythritol 4-phosphate cytidylyltransferase [Chitinophagales bacterium]